ncbi:uncharacterized protein LOC132752375 [Ruditapes philippinarum]|uniref:uncharacterized protein LOC132752375 n=1 Tax=Ruditapes philippinarum TaxID=129788 RepID=UPI00295AFCCA|nr:uncharacterized protein LOC132752375 [Ruditapes philippinarum]
MGCFSSKRQRDMNDFQEVIRDIEARCTDIAQALDSVSNIAKTFISQLEDKENHFTDTRSSNFEQLYTKLMNLYATAIQLMVSIQAASQKKECFINQVNKDLDSITAKLEQVLKTKYKGQPRLRPGSYLEAHVVTSADSPANAQGDIVSQMRKTVENSSQSVITNILKNVQNLEDEFRNVKEMIDELKAQNTERDLHKLDIFGQKIEQIQNQVNVETEGDTESGALEQLKTERDLLRKQVEELERQTEEHKITIAKLNKEMLDKENISKVFAVKSESMQREFENARMLLQKENEEIKLELEILKKKSAYEVQLFCQTETGLIKTIEEKLMTELRSRLNNKGKEVKFVKCQDTSNVEADKPLLLLCINASRLGTDASTLVKKFKVSSKKMAVLVCHHKDEHALPAQSSDRVLSGPEFKGIGGIYDVAFHVDKGIYPCEMNENNIANVIKFIAVCSV